MATGTLGLSACGFLTRIFVTHANILTSPRSTMVPTTASPHGERSPTIVPKDDPQLRRMA